MPLIRLLATLAVAMLLCGSACRPVYSDRPMGSQPLTKPFGPDKGGQPSDLDGLWLLEYGEIPRPLFVVSPGEPGRFVLGDRIDGKHDETEVEVRQHSSKDGHRWLFFSVEDRVLKGSFLWALAPQYNADTFLVWYTNERSDVFKRMVEGGQLPGRVVETRAGKSGIESWSIEQTLILEGIEERHLDFIIEHRAELFELAMPHLLTRIRRPFPPQIRPDESRPAVPPAASSPAPRSP